MNNFRSIGKEIGELVASKNQAYGDSFAVAPAILKMLYPDGIRVDQYPDVLSVTRVLDKLKRIATDRDALGENPWRDIAGYAILAIANTEVSGNKNTSE
jgi:hypothetical protein